MIQSKTFTAEWEKATAPDPSITPVFQQVHQPDPAPPEWAGVTTPSHPSDPALSADTLESSRTYLSPEIQDAFSHRNATDDQLDLDLEMFNLKEHLSQDDTEGQEKIKSYEQLRIKRGEQPFQFLEAAISRQENRDFHKTMDSFSILFSGPENYEKAYPEEQRQKIAADFSNLQDATTAKIESANRIAVSRMAGLPVETVNADWPLYKNAYAKRALDWKEEGDIPDAEFYKRFGNKVTEQKADMALMEQVGRIGQYAAIRSKSYSAAADEARKLVGDRFSKFEPALKSSYASILADHSDGELQAASTLFNYRTRQEAISSGGSPRTRKEALEMGTEKLAELRTGNDDALLYYATADQKTRDRMMGLMGVMAQKEGVDLKNPGDRYSAAFASGVGNIVTGITAPIGHLGSNIYHTLANHEDDPEKKSSYRRTAYLADAPEILDTDFRTSGIKIARYMDDKREGLWDTLMDTSLIITESAPLMAASAVPYVGIPVATSTFAETNKSELRRSNPDLPQWQRDTLAYTAGFTQAIIEKAQVKTLGTGLKNTTGLMMQMGKTGALGAGLLRVGTITAAQTLQEVAQDLVLPTFTQIAAAADSDIKGPDWHQVYTREKQAIGDIARVSLLLSLAGGAGSTISDYIAMPELQRQLTDHSLLRLHGLSQLQAQDLALMAEKNPLTAADAFKSILEKADPAQRTANSQAEKDRLITVARNTPSPTAAGIPHITPAPNGRTLVQWNDGQGHQELFDTPQQARDAVNLSTTQQDIELTRMNRQQIESFLSTTRSQEIQRLQKTAGPHIRVDLDNDAPPLPLSQWAGQSSRRITRARERVRIELRQAANDMGLTIPDAEIDLDEWFTLGTSSNSYAKGITTIAIRLASDTQGNGRTGTPLDAIQEFSEGISKHLRDRAGLPWQRQVQWIREAETSTRRSFLQNDLRSLPEGLRNQAIDEALSTIAVGYATGRITESQAPGGLRAYLHAFRRMLGEIFTLARDIRTYSQSGTMDPEFRQYLDLATGFSEDTTFANPTADDMETTNVMDETTLALAPLGTGLRRITQAPEVIQLSNPFPEQITEPSALRKEFWKNFDAITTNWPKIIQTPEGPIAWSKNKTGNKLRSFKEGEPALLHFIAAANLPELLANSKIAAVIPENKGDQTVAEVHRRYAWADFPNGNRRHVLLTIERMSDKAREDLQETDQAYSTEILGLSLEILPENKSADVVNLKADQRQNLQPGQAITSAETILTRFRSGIKPEHQFIESVAPSENDPTLSIGQKGTSREGKTKSDQDQFGPKLHKDITPEENLERATKALAWATRKKADAQGIAYRKELGRIDIPWGRPGHSAPVMRGQSKVTHTDGYGLSHIIEKHGKAAAQLIPEILVKGTVSLHKTPLKRTIQLGSNILIMSKEQVDSSFAITSFDLNDSAPQSSKTVRQAPEAQSLSKVRQKRMNRSLRRESN